MLFWYWSFMKYANGNTLELFIGINVDAKLLLNRFAFSHKSETNLPLTNKGGIAGIFCL